MSLFPIFCSSGIRGVLAGGQHVVAAKRVVAVSRMPHLGVMQGSHHQAHTALSLAVSESLPQNSPLLSAASSAVAGENSAITWAPAARVMSG